MRVLFYLFPLILLAFAKKNSTDLDKLIQRITDENGPLWQRIKKLYEEKNAATQPTTESSTTASTSADTTPTTTAASTTTEGPHSRQERLSKILLANPEIQARIAAWIASGIVDISFYEHNGVCYFHNANTWESLLTFICPIV